MSLGMVIYFADHLAHSIQIDAINRRVERNTRRAIAEEDVTAIEETTPRTPEWAVPLLARKSGYIQTVEPQLLLPLVSDADVTICLRKRVGEHVVEGTVLAWVWAPSPENPRPYTEPYATAVDADVRIGFERTIEQDVAFGIRQQIDIGCKALSPAVNDPYTAAQAIDHLAVVCADLAVRPLGTKVVTGSEGRGRVIVPGNNFADYIFFIGGLFGRYGSSDLGVMLALILMFETLSRCFRRARRGWRYWKRQPSRPLTMRNDRCRAHPAWSGCAQPSRLYVSRSTLDAEVICPG